MDFAFITKFYCSFGGNVIVVSCQAMAFGDLAGGVFTPTCRGKSQPLENRCSGATLEAKTEF
jgi:hypothetical protein